MRAATSLRAAQTELIAARRAGDDATAEAADERRRQAARALDSAGVAVTDTRTTIGSALDLAGELTDPRALIGALSSDLPFLLFPVRLETRFRQVAPGNGAAPRSQLWVRIFPDDCLVDTFSESLTGVEVASARAYWARVWAAAESKAGERAAWRPLVAGHGSGRAGWVVDHYAPANPADAPQRTDPTQVFLVLAVSALPPAAEAAALTAFWTAWWRADDDAAAKSAATQALSAAVGAARAAELATLPPAGLEAEPVAPATRATAPVIVAFAELSDVPETTDSSWSRAPQVDLLPDRFVLIAESAAGRIELLGRPIPPTVFTGPDPTAPVDQQLQQVDGELVFPDELAWIADFDRAVHDGLGFVVDLDPEQAESGFDRLYVLGTRALRDPAESAGDLERLLIHHQHSRSGFALLPQGTATNNTETDGSGFSRDDDPDDSFDARRAGPVGAEPDPASRTDGQVLATALGIRPGTLDGVPHAHGHDQREARAMQTLLWPATMGYLLGTLLEPVLDDDTVEQARWFFTRHVRGRGGIPAIRIGAQPYGILATSALSRRRPPPALEESSRARFLADLQRVLQVADREWSRLTAQVPTLGWDGAPTTDAQRTLLGILGLHPTSAEYGYRYAQTMDELVNRAHLAGWGAELYRFWTRQQLDGPARRLLAELGWDGRSRVPLLELYFHGRHAPLTGPLVDDRPLSETDQVRAYTSDGRNYLAWLRDAATASLDELRSDAAFAAGVPNALLFLLTRHALLLGYAESGRGLHRLAGFEPAVVRAQRREPPFVHVRPDGPSESRFAALYKHDAVISPEIDRSVAAVVADVLFESPGTAVLREQIEALAVLADVPTARLERLLAEHLDTVGYRLDSWQLGGIDLQLESLRSPPVVIDIGDGEGNGEGEAPPAGIHLGAYGWLEDVRPKNRGLLPAQLPADLAEVFDGEPALMSDPTSGGHLLAPSLNQAVTAAVLRSGYISAAGPAQPGAMAVNLSSQRTRRAVEILDGMRAGQSLGALLGYALERGVHDRSPFAEVDVFVFALRRRFPLVTGRLTTTAVPGESIQSLEARNVVDGLALVEHVERTGATAYPFALVIPGEIPAADAAQQAALNAEIDALRDLRDAVGDLELAEAVHQAVQGGAERAGATLRTVQSGHQPAEPEVIRTPDSGTTLTHRVGVHLDPSAAVSPGATPRALLQPAVDSWLAGVLPPVSSIGCTVHWDDPVSGTARSAAVTLADLGLHPVDVVELLRDTEQSMTELDDRVVARVAAVATPRPDAALTIAYREAAAGQLPVFEVAALAEQLRLILSRSRPLRASDVVVSGEATSDLDVEATLDPAPLVAVHAVLTTLVTDVTAFLATWQPLLADVPTNLAALLAGTDTAVADATALLDRGGRLAVPGAGWGGLVANRQAQFAATVAAVDARSTAWTARLGTVDARLAAYDALPSATPDETRLAELVAITSLIAPAVGAADPDPAVERAAVGARRDAFAAHRDQLAAIVSGTAGGLVALRGQLQAALPFTDVDSEPFDTVPIDRAMVGLVEDAVGTVAALGAEMGRRATAAQDALDRHAAAADEPTRRTALQECATALLGDGIHLLPRFQLPAPAAAEWDQAVAAVPELLGYLTGDLAADLPVEDWLHSVARVREPVHAWEQAGLLAEALGGPELSLTPIQLPHRPGQRWLALEHPPDVDLGGEHLLYTAAYPAGFVATATTCGLLLDEWTEVLPADNATAGLAFHYDRPSSEAPQALLLVTPASSIRGWDWEDLLQALPDTFALARQRAVEPAHLTGPEARFLPATVSAITVSAISISLMYAVNNGVYTAMEDR
ncbi:MAG: hypothetical protein LC789_09260 [Actinobacteria bacterium]|nr:hypothetical protein [Actinomycetota bacterium]